MGSVLKSLFQECIENRAYEKPATMLLPSDRKRWHSPPLPVGLPWNSPLPPPESVRAGGRTLTSQPKFLASIGY